MANIQASDASFFTPGSPSAAVTDVAGVRHGRRNAVIGLAAVGIAAAAIGGWAYVQSTAVPAVAPASKLAAGVQVWQGYAPGGSIYRQQVPAAAARRTSGVRTRRQRLRPAGPVRRLPAGPHDLRPRRQRLRQQVPQ